MSDIEATAAAVAEEAAFVRPNLQRQMWEGRAVKNNILTTLTWIIAILAAIPLISVIYMLLIRGGTRLFGSDIIEVLTALPPAGFEMGGGIGPAIIGTLVMVAIATATSVPFGIMAAIYLAILGPTSKLAGTSRFLAKVLTGFPSILAGVFVYAVLVVNFGYSPWAFGIGCTRTQVIWKVVLPTGLPGILTGVMLAIAGAAGESAPLLFTALFSNYYLESLTAVNNPTASLSILIYNFSGMPFENQIELAWTASLVLVLIVLVFNILARLVGQPKV